MNPRPRTSDLNFRTLCRFVIPYLSPPSSPHSLNQKSFDWSILSITFDVPLHFHAFFRTRKNPSFVSFIFLSDFSFSISVSQNNEPLLSAPSPFFADWIHSSKVHFPPFSSPNGHYHRPRSFFSSCSIPCHYPRAGRLFLVTPFWPSWHARMSGTAILPNISSGQESLRVLSASFSSSPIQFSFGHPPKHSFPPAGHGQYFCLHTLLKCFLHNSSRFPSLQKATLCVPEPNFFGQLLGKYVLFIWFCIREVRENTNLCSFRYNPCILLTDNLLEKVGTFRWSLLHLFHADRISNLFLSTTQLIRKFLISPKSYPTRYDISILKNWSNPQHPSVYFVCF